MQTFFAFESGNASQKARHKARIISEILHDNINRLYFIFLCPIVQEFEKVNALFQSQNADPEELMKELDIHYQSLERRLYSHEGAPLSIDNVDFGAHFASELAKYREKCQNDEPVNTLLQRCHEFLIYLLKEVQARLPPNKKVYIGLCGLVPKKILSQVDRLNFSDLSMQHLMHKRNEIEEKSHYIFGKKREFLKTIFQQKYFTLLEWNNAYV